MWTKVKAKDIKNQAFLTTGTAPDYEITIPRETSYLDMDRMEILVNFHTNWSWTITLNINWLGAKDTWLTSITNDSYYTLIYDLSQDKFIATEVWDSILDWAYDSSWDWDISNAPSRNAVYDKIESIENNTISRWDEIIAGTDYTAASLWTWWSTTSATYIKLKSAEITKKWQYRIHFSYGASWWWYSRVKFYLNWVAYSWELKQRYASWDAVYSVDLDLEIWDTVEWWAMQNTNLDESHINWFTVSYSLASEKVETTNNLDT